MVRQPSPAQFPGESAAMRSPTGVARQTFPASAVLLGGLILLSGLLFYVLGTLPQEVAAIATTETLIAEEQKLLAAGRELVDETFYREWDEKETSSSDTSTAKIEAGHYQVYFSAAGQHMVILARPLANFVAEVDCMLLEGSPAGECGIVFADQAGAVENPRQGYFFFVSGKMYGLELHTESSSSSLRERSAAIRTGNGSTNHLRVVQIESEIRLYVNGKLVNRFHGNPLGEGGVGFRAASSAASSDVQVAVDNFRVWEIP